MTTSSIKTKVTEARKVFEEILQLNQVGNVRAWETGKRLSYMKKSGLFKFVVGDQTGKSDKELALYKFFELCNLPKSTGEGYVRLWEFWVEEMKLNYQNLADISYRKLLLAIPFLREKKFGVDEVLSYARELSIQDYSKFLSGNKLDCYHTDTEEKDKRIKICKNCGKEIKK